MRRGLVLLDLWKTRQRGHEEIVCVVVIDLRHLPQDRDPVSFLRLWHALVAKFVPTPTGSVVQLGFLNCAGCHLRPGHPGSIAYRSENLYPLRPWREPHLELPFRNLPIDFEPDFEAYELTCRTYAAFGFEREAVPLFDKDRRFTP